MYKRKRGTSKPFSGKRRRLFTPAAASIPRAPRRMINVVRGRGPVAPKTLVKLKYVEDVVSPGTTIDHIWNLNSLFDPNRTGTGHQPYGFDTYATLYNRYRVYRVDYTIRFAVIVVNSSYKAIVVANNDTSTFTSDSLMAESPGARTIFLTTSQPGTLSGSFYLPYVTGATPTQYKSDDKYEALTTGSPSELIILHMGWAGIGGGAPSSNQVGAQVTLTYHAEFFDDKPLAQS